MFPEDVAASVEQLWLAPTLTRTVEGDPARVPFELYLVFVDEPAVTAAAARHLGLARYEVEAIDGGWYRATDNDGASGVWRVLAREPTRRVVLSRGEHSGRLLGHIGGMPFYISGPQFEYWQHTHLIIDVVPGRGGMFSLEGPTGQRFLTRSRLYSDEEWAQLEAQEAAATAAAAGKRA